MIRFLVFRLKKVIRKIQFFFRDKIINPKYRERLKNRDFSIICNDCLGGVICKDLRCRFNSPTVNFFFMAGDYIKFISRIEEYVKTETFHDVTEKGDAYPRVSIEIEDEYIVAYCVHYKSAEEFIRKWNERKARINYENCFFIMNDRNGFTEEHLKVFEALPYKNKVCFVHREYPEYPSTFYIKGAEKEEFVKTMTGYTPVFGIKRRYDAFDFVSWFNTGKKNA